MEEYSYTSTQPLGQTGPVTGSLYLLLFLREWCLPSRYIISTSFIGSCILTKLTHVSMDPHLFLRWTNYLQANCSPASKIPYQVTWVNDFKTLFYTSCCVLQGYDIWFEWSGQGAAQPFVGACCIELHRNSQHCLTTGTVTMCILTAAKKKLKSLAFKGTVV